MPELAKFLAGLIDRYRKQPGPGMLSALVHDDGPDGPYPRSRSSATPMLMLFAGHETTVNLIAHSVMTLLRHPDQLEKLRRRPELIVPGVEELLRFESSVQFWPTRSALEDIEIAGTTIPKGSPIYLLLRLGEPRPGTVREPRRARPRTPGQRARRLQPGHPLLLRRPACAAGGPDRGQRVRPSRGEPAARRGPAAVPPQPDLPRPAPPPGSTSTESGTEEMTMQAFRLVEPQKPAELREVPVPEPGPGRS